MDFAGPSVPRIRYDGNYRSRWWGGSSGSRGLRQLLLGPIPNTPFLA